MMTPGTLSAPPPPSPQGPPTCVRPVQVPPNPVHGQAIRGLQVRGHDHLRPTPIKVRSPKIIK